jgi:hypothetical protein
MIQFCSVVDFELLIETPPPLPALLYNISFPRSVAEEFDWLAKPPPAKPATLPLIIQSSIKGCEDSQI